MFDALKDVARSHVAGKVRASALVMSAAIRGCA
jgi:hypothetical protein